MFQYNIGTLQNNTDQLFNERSELQQFVSRFKNSNKRYIQIKRITEVIDRLLAERKSLLTLALVAVIEVLRMNPDR